MTRILIVDDEESICWGLARLCEQMSIESETVSSAEQGLKLAQDSQFDVVIMDIRLPGMDGLSAIRLFHEQHGPVPVITITAFGDLETAIEAVQKGAFEYIVKPFELETVRTTIRQAVATGRIIASRASANPQVVEEDDDKAGLVGSSPIMQEVYKQIALATTTEAPVLITGESGTGKELTARAIHQFGPRAAGPFIAVNIAALSPTLVESELFGHAKGAFTGADADRIGLIQQAGGGTLFLDEIAEIPLNIQVKLLRVLDTGDVTPVGSNVAVKTDFRLISATHQDLLAQVNHGEFRHDLLYRLRTLEIRLPPLRQRKEDIPELVRHFLKRVRGTEFSMTQGFFDTLVARSWHGNVRELQNVVARAATLARGGVLTARQVDESVTGQLAQAVTAPTADGEIRRLVRNWTTEHWDDDSSVPLYPRLLEVIEPAIFATAFQLSDNQYSAAARRLGIHRTTLKKKLDDPE